MNLYFDLSGAASMKAPVEADDFLQRQYAQGPTFQGN